MMISIAMGTYNGEKFIREQFDSILAQTIQDFELVVCDDCSTDSTVSILQEYVQKDSRVKIFENEKNLGYVKNFEKAISLCSGEFIALSDQDDIWLPCHLQVLRDNIGENFMVGADAFLIDGEGNGMNETLSHRIGFDSQRNYRIFYRIFCNSSVLYGHSCLYKTLELKKALPIPGGVYYHDAWFSAVMCVLGEIKYVNEPITKYRLHGKNASGRHENFSFIQRVKNFLSSQPQQKTDRIIYCNEILNRFKENLSENALKEMVEVREYHSNRCLGKHRMKTAKFFVNHYHDIYTTESKKDLPFRVMSVLLGHGRK